MPIGKVDVERRIVSGFATLDNLDKQKDIVSKDASVRAFQNFRGNLREMHQPSAVGKVISFKEDRYFDPNTKKFYEGIFVSSYVSKGAQDAWEKVLDGTYTGFSIGGNIKDYDDVFNEDMNKTVRIIKDYELYELSLVDSPANQFASIISVEKVDGESVFSGSSADIEIENVFWDPEAGIVLLSGNESEKSPSSGKEMKNIGFVEKSDSENVEMIKFLVDSAKGISAIKMTKEVSPMTENTDAVVTEDVVTDAEINKSEAAPEAIVGSETEVVEKAEKPMPMMDEEETPAMADAEVPADEDAEEKDKAKANVSKSEEVVAEAVAEIQKSLTSAFSDLATVITAINEQIAGLTKSIDSVTSNVTAVKDEFNEFGKRVDALDADTAFRKSGDLGEIVQLEPVQAQKSLWGGSFLKSADLLR
jgi:hypothetical protein